MHQLRHSALQHLVEAGRTAPELQAKSRHQSLASLGRYIRLGEETSAALPPNTTLSPAAGAADVYGMILEG
ncbi:hypothetical protein [Nonomuraea insulae]|uniref:Tyr recombinase domain-containing protein n=1 Tax=Nonomuraea insulae TaxID=1616787 RepID=A0ABW1CF23_9ACTN